MKAIKSTALLLFALVTVTVALFIATLESSDAQTKIKESYASQLVQQPGWFKYCDVVGITSDGELLASYSGEYWQQALHHGSNGLDAKLPRNGPLNVRAIRTGKI